MSELIEYRVKRLERTVTLTLVFILEAVVISTTLILEAISSLSVEGLAWMVILFGAALVFWGGAYAMSTDGYARRLYERVFGEMRYPPLDEWEDQLEEDGAFGGERV